MKSYTARSMTTKVKDSRNLSPMANLTDTSPWATWKEPSPLLTRMDVGRRCTFRPSLAAILELMKDLLAPVS